VAVRPVLRLPAPQLKMVAEPVAELNQPAVQAIADDLVDTMRAYDHCVGLVLQPVRPEVRG
jgi:peptide deformylase